MPTKEKVKQSLYVPERIAAILRSKGVLYMGGCILQAQSAWTRIGPTWYVPGLGWYCYGPGVAQWGTKRGLGQLASASDAAPSWHDGAWVVAPDPNIVLYVEDNALDAPYMASVKRFVTEATEWWGSPV